MFRLLWLKKKNPPNPLSYSNLCKQSSSTFFCCRWHEVKGSCTKLESGTRAVFVVCISTVSGTVMSQIMNPAPTCPCGAKPIMVIAGSCCYLETLSSALVFLLTRYCVARDTLWNPKNFLWVPAFCNDSVLLPSLWPLAVFCVCERRHKLNGSPALLWVKSNKSSVLMLQPQPQVSKSQAGTTAREASSPDLSGLWCFPRSLPLYLSCPDVMSVTGLFFTALCNASGTVVALRVFVIFHEFYDGFFLLNAYNSLGSFTWREMRGTQWPYMSICSAITHSLNENENLKEVKSQQDPESDTFSLEKELRW